MRKLYFTILLLFVCASLFKSNVKAQTAPSEGTGTSIDPYEIASFANLHWIAETPSSWDKHFIQTATIDASITADTESEWGTDGWWPIGTFSNPFSGKYNGQDYSITNLSIGEKTVDEDNNGVGLFGYTSSSASIENLVVSNISIVAHLYVGAVVGSNRGDIFNSHSSGLIVAWEEVGGIVGNNLNSSLIEFCSSSADIEGDTHLGNIVGYNEGNLSYCHAAGGSVKGFANSGVIGGLIGTNFGSVSLSYTNTTVSSSNRSVKAGGLIGENHSEISKCFSQGPVTASGTSARTGGLVGNLKSSGTISNSYTTSYLSGTNRGGLVSLNDAGTPYSNVTNSFWCSTTSVSNATSSQGGTSAFQFNMRQITTYTNVGWKFNCETWGINGSNNGQYPFLLWQNDYGYAPGDCNYWTGASGTDWATASNWLADEVPGTTDNTLIRSGLTNYPEISSSVTMNLIHIGTDDAKLTVNAGGALTVTTNLINNSDVDGLILKSTSATNSASVILSNANNDPVPATVERYITPSASSVLFHIVSTPVSGQTIQSFISDNSSVIAYSSSGGVYAMKTYKADGTGWDSNYNGTELTNVLTGKSYSIGIKVNATTLVFKGTLLSANESETIIGTGTGFGWNSIGNPYPASLNVRADANGFLTKTSNSSQLDPEYTALYVWDPSTSQYTVINGSSGQSYLAPSQGFIVKGKSGGGTVIFETAMRAHQTPTFYKSAMVDEDWYKINLQVQNASAKILNNSIVFNSLMTNDLDIGYDAGLLTDNAAYNLFTRMPVEANDTKFMVQALPTTWDNPVVIPVGLQYDAGGEVVISTPTFTMPEGVMFWLEDRTASTFTNLATNTYTITLPANADSLGRFFLHIGKAVTSVELTTSDDLTYCENETVNVLLTASADGVNYKWYKNDVLIPNATSKTYAATAAGSYKVVASVGGSSATSNAIVVVVNSLPEAAIATTDGLAYCQGENIDVEFTASPAGASYQWFKNGEPIANAIAAGYTATTPGEYSVEVTLSGCSAKSDTSEVIENNLPTLTVPDDLSVCEGETVQLTATGTADTYVWDNDVVNGEVFTPAQTATYTVTASITATGCQVTDEVTVTVNALPVVTAPDDINICIGQNVMLYAVGNANTYEWDNDVVNGQTFTPIETLTYTVTGTNTSTGCQSSDEVLVTVNPLPTITLPESFAVCNGDKVTLNATGDADLYQWDNDVVNGEEFMPTETETYNVVATITATGCESAAEVTVTVNPRPVIMLASDTILLAVQDQHLFDAGEGFASYLWFNESTEQTYLFVASEWGEGVYEIWAEVSNEFACSTRDTAVVNVKTTTGIGTESLWSVNLYPNPTSGDINLNVSGLNDQKVSVTIVSALGQLIYQNEVQVSGGQIQEVINLRNNSSGVYMMIISDGANKLTRRIVIK